MNIPSKYFKSLLVSIWMLIVIFLFWSLLRLVNTVGPCNAGIVFYFGVPFIGLYTLISLIGVWRKVFDDAKGKWVILVSTFLGIFPFIVILPDEAALVALTVAGVVVGNSLLLLLKKRD